MKIPAGDPTRAQATRVLVDLVGRLRADGGAASVRYNAFSEAIEVHPATLHDALATFDWGTASWALRSPRLALAVDDDGLRLRF